MKILRRVRGATCLGYFLAAFGLLSFILHTGALAQTPKLLGDLDSDRSPTILDLQLLINHLNAGTNAASPGFLEASLRPYADINEDGLVNGDDLLLLQDAILGRSTLPNPYAAPVVSVPTFSTNGSSVTITGTARPNRRISITGGRLAVFANSDSNGLFTAKVQLRANQVNALYITATNATFGGGIPQPLRVLQDSQPPNLFIDFPTHGTVLYSESTFVAGRVGDSLSGFLGLTVSTRSTASQRDLPAVVDVGIGNNGTYQRSNFPLEEGTNVIRVTATDIHGNSNYREITVIRRPLMGPRLLMLSGDGQKTNVHRRLAAPIIVKAMEADGVTPLANTLVTFEVTRSDGRLRPAPPSVAVDMSRLTSDINATPHGIRSLQMLTDATGIARAYWAVGGDAGCGNNRVCVTSAGISNNVYFCASADAALPNQINVGTGNNQKAETGGFLPEPLRAWVNDSCNGNEGQLVTFTVVRGSGKLTRTGSAPSLINPPSGNSGDAVAGFTTLTVLTTRTGHAEVLLQLGPDAGQNIVEANYPGNPNLPATFIAYGVARDPSKSTSLNGLVLDNTSSPIGGVTCQLRAAGQSLFTLTDPQGRYTFSSVPSGPAQLLVDGSTADTLRAAALPPNSFPSLEFQLIVIPNAENSLPGPVLLPRLNLANQRLYYGTNDLVLTCEGMEGLKMTIKAGSMRKPDGTLVTPDNSTLVSLNQVHHDNVPMPIPDGASPPFAWTLQPGGSTFDPPVQIEYPNMSGLPAGTIAYFLSFNHDTRRFEIIASGHVREDSSTIVSDAGAGLTIAGWGCNCPPYSVTGNCEAPDPVKCSDNPQCELQIAVDANRDGIIRFDATDSTIARPFEFWVNNDHDTDDPVSGGDVSDSPPDSLDGKLSSERDMEDLFRLQIRFCPEMRELLKCGYRLQLDLGGLRAKVYKALYSGLDPVLYSLAASSQRGASYFFGQREYRFSDAIEPNLLSNYLTESDFSSGEAGFLVEGVAPGTGGVRLLLTRGTLQFKSEPVAVRLLDVKRMYETVTAQDYLLGQDVSNFPQPPSTAANGLFKIESYNDSRIEDSTNRIVFVHGWDMSEWDKDSFSATMFKRLWWAGFKGSFVSFRWPALVQSVRLTCRGAWWDPDFIDPSLEGNGFMTFNRSEFLAYSYAPCLTNYLAEVRNINVHLAAHSQGNILCSEALRLGGRAKTYVMMQSAVPASALDGNAPDDPGFALLESLNPTFGNSDAASQLDRGYKKWFESIGGNARIVNFYNGSPGGDYALGFWHKNQESAKPSYYPISLSNYEFVPDFPPDSKHAVTFKGTGFFQRFVEDQYEVMAFMCRPRSGPVGTYGTRGGAISTNYDVGFGSACYEHSGQFNYNIQRLWPFYTRLLTECGITPTPIPPGSRPVGVEAALGQSASDFVDDTWTFSVNGQIARADLFGAFTVHNISAPDQFGPGGPGTRPDFLSDDYVRLIGQSSANGTNRFAFSEFFQVAGQRQAGINSPMSYGVTNLTFTHLPPRKPELLSIVLSNRTVFVGQNLSLTVLARFPDGATSNVAPRTSWTSYRISNPNIATVSSDGVVTPINPGVVYVTAVNEGAAAVCGLNIVGQAGDVTVLTGKVVDTNGVPVSGAIVRICDLVVEPVTTGSDGQFSISNVPAMLGVLSVNVRGFVGGRMFVVSLQVQGIPGGQTSLGELVMGRLIVSGQASLSAGLYHSVALRENGTLWTWGRNNFGQLGNGTSKSASTPQPIHNDATWRVVSAGDEYTAALRADGTLWTWGRNGFEQLGNGTNRNSNSPQLIQPNVTWQTVAAGGAHTLAIRDDGTLWVWGYNNNGQLGNGTVTRTNTPQPIQREMLWQAVAAGVAHSVALRDDGTLWAWGDNTSGQLGNGASTNAATPQAVQTNVTWRNIAAGRSHTAALRSNCTLWTWGDNTYGQLGNGNNLNANVPQLIHSNFTWQSVVAGGGHTVALRNDGTLWAWGDNTYGQLGNGTFRSANTPQPIQSSNTWQAVAAGLYHTVAIRSDGSLWTWGWNDDGQLGRSALTSTNTPQPIQTNVLWQTVTAGAAHSIALSLDGTLWTWGTNSSGELGNGSFANSSMPTIIQNGVKWQAAAAGFGHNVALRSDGTLWTWGRNNLGQLGTGSSAPNANSPQPIQSNLVWRAIAAGDSHSIALRADNTLWSWGNNNFGQLGVGPIVRTNRPQPILTNTAWQAVAVGGSQSAALQLDGTFWSWGDNRFGQLGDGTFTSTNIPQLIQTNLTWQAVAVGGSHTVALHIDGTLWSWGDNRFGQLGAGTFTSTNIPQPIQTNVTWQAVAVGGSHTVALHADGTLWAWGRNSSGQLGIGNVASANAPRPVQPGRRWKAISAGANHTLAVRDDDTLWAWGDNSSGQIAQPVLWLPYPVLGDAVWGPPRP